MSNSTGNGSTSIYNSATDSTDQTDQKYVYPMPQKLASLLQPGDSFKSVDFNSLAHPSFLHKTTTEQFIKMFKFGLWAEYALNASNDLDTLSDVVKKELDTFSNNGFNLREDFQVKFEKNILSSDEKKDIYCVGANFPKSCSECKT